MRDTTAGAAMGVRPDSGLARSRGGCGRRVGWAVRGFGALLLIVAADCSAKAAAITTLSYESDKTHFTWKFTWTGESIFPIQTFLPTFTPGPGVENPDPWRGRDTELHPYVSVGQDRAMGFFAQHFIGPDPGDVNPGSRYAFFIVIPTYNDTDVHDVPGALQRLNHIHNPKPNHRDEFNVTFRQATAGSGGASSRSPASTSRWRSPSRPPWRCSE